MDELNWDAARDHVLKASHAVDNFVASSPDEQLRAAEIHAMVGLAMSNLLMAQNLRSDETP